MNRNCKGNLTRASVALLGLIAVTGCATNFEPKPLSAGHPASPQAQEAPRSRTSHLIMTDELSRKTEMQLTRKDGPNPDVQDTGMLHDMSKMPGMDHPEMKVMPAPAATASPVDVKAVEGEMKVKSDSAKSDKNKTAASNSTPAAVVYTCPMHPEINLPAPGKCPKCGMILVKKESGAK